MIYRARTMNLIPQKAAAVRAVCVRAAAYVNEHFPGIHVEILENVAGSLNQIHMVTRCESLAALETYEAQRAKDPGWLALVEEVNALRGTTEVMDSLYRVILSSADHDAAMGSKETRHGTVHIPASGPLLEYDENMMA